MYIATHMICLSLLISFPTAFVYCHVKVMTLYHIKYIHFIVSITIFTLLAVDIQKSVF